MTMRSISGESVAAMTQILFDQGVQRLRRHFRVAVFEGKPNRWRLRRRFNSHVLGEGAFRRSQLARLRRRRSRDIRIEGRHTNAFNRVAHHRP